MHDFSTVRDCSIHPPKVFQKTVREDFLTQMALSRRDSNWKIPIDIWDATAASSLVKLGFTCLYKRMDWIGSWKSWSHTKAPSSYSSNMDEKSNILMENFWDYYLPYSAFNSEWLGPLLGAVSRGELETPNVVSWFPFLHVVEPTASKKRDQWITKLYWKSNGKIEIFGKKMYGKEVLLDRVFPLVRLTGQLAYVSRTKVFPTPLPMFALWVVKPHHVIPHLKLLFPKSFNGTNIFSVQFSLFDPKFLTVCFSSSQCFHFSG